MSEFECECGGYMVPMSNGKRVCCRCGSTGIRLVDGMTSREVTARERACEEIMESQERLTMDSDDGGA